MNTTDYLLKVTTTVAKVGHRGNSFFTGASTLAAGALLAGPEGCDFTKECTRCRDMIHTGLQLMQPSNPAYDAYTVSAYRELVSGDAEATMSKAEVRTCICAEYAFADGPVNDWLAKFPDSHRFSKDQAMAEFGAYVDQLPAMPR